MALARWLVAPENPLTPRVLANRLWHYHFGIGIVDTPSDFGAMGSLPTHPELLDWLAGQVHAQGWRLKPLHRLIVTSAAYQQASTFRADAAGTRWRQPAALAIPAAPARGRRGARHDPLPRRPARSPHGRPRFPALSLPRGQRGYLCTARRARPGNVSPGGLSPERAGVARGRAHRLRLSRLRLRRAAPRRHDEPAPGADLDEPPFTLDMAAALAERLEREAGSDDPEAQVRRAFLLAYARLPDAEEVRAASRLVRRHGLRAFCRAVLNSNELIALY